MQKSINTNLDYIYKISKFNFLLAIFGFFVYSRSWEAMLAIFGLALLFDYVPLIGFIPIAGPFIYWNIAHKAINWYLGLVSLNNTWLTGLIFWIGFIEAIIFSIFGIAAIVGLWVWISDKLK